MPCSLKMKLVDILAESHDALCADFNFELMIDGISQTFAPVWSAEPHLKLFYATNQFAALNLRRE